jgi:hypothetical protein
LPKREWSINAQVGVSGISTAGEIITNYHVVGGYSDVAVVFKPTIEGKEPTHDDIKLGHVVKFDQAADLALVKAVDVPKGRNPIRLGDSSDLAIGTDVRAIGHPKAQTWTYTTGIVSQYRIGFEWTIENIKHKADVIQTQTPISPGNSGGPLIGESSALIGVNTLQKSDAENLNFAVSVDDVKRFLARPGNRFAPGGSASLPKKNCEPKEISRSRNKANDVVVVEYDIDCSGRVDADYVIPDKKTEAIRSLGTGTEMVSPMLSISTSNDEGNGTFHFGMKILVGIGPWSVITSTAVCSRLRMRAMKYFKLDD